MSYRPTFPGEEVRPDWLYDELTRVGTEMNKFRVAQFDVLTAEPSRPAAGMVACADGTNWHPKSVSFSSTASSSGLFLYLNGSWSKL